MPLSKKQQNLLRIVTPKYLNELKDIERIFSKWKEKYGRTTARSNDNTIVRGFDRSRPKQSDNSGYVDSRGGESQPAASNANAGSAGRGAEHGLDVGDVKFSQHSKPDSRVDRPVKTNLFSQKQPAPDAGFSSPKTGNTVELIKDSLSKMLGIDVTKSLPNVSILQAATPEIVSKLENGQLSVVAWHGSYENKPFKINNDGLFGGIFAGYSKSVANSHGNYLYEINLDESDIANISKIDALSDDDLSEIFPGVNDVDRLRELLIEDDQPNEDDNNILNPEFDEDGYRSWAVQKMQGIAAKKMGYKAIELEDEHGNVLLIVDDGTKLKADSLYSKQQNDSIQGAYDGKTGRIYLFADNIKHGEENAVLLHEIFHKRGDELLGRYLPELV